MFTIYENNESWKTACLKLSYKNKNNVIIQRDD